MSNNLITPSQYGFIPGKSTVDALQRTVDNLYSAFDDGMVSVGICLNLTKAFDSLDRRILCRKLEFYGVTGQSLAWFHSYLARRKQHVRYRNILFEARNNNYGVPQGGCISAFLFLIFINDICNATERANFVLYADDTNMFVNSRSAEDAMRIARDSLAAVYKWFCDNRLTLNISKSSFAIYHRKGRRMHGDNFALEINNVNLERVKSVKFLGVILDDHLSWEHHVNVVTSRISKLIPLIHKIRDNLSSSSLRQIYFALIYPSLTYCIAVWGSCNSTVFQGVMLVMKRVVRIMSFSNRFEHSGPLFLRFNLLDYFNIKKYMLLLFVYKALCTGSGYFSFISHERITRQTNQKLLQLPNVISTHSRRGARWTRVGLWNALPLGIREADTYDSFKRNLKSHLLREQRDRS